MTYWTKFHKDGKEVGSGWVCGICDRRNQLPTPYCPYCGTLLEGKMQETKQTSVDMFMEASHWEDWINRYTEDVYEIYWNWCIRTEVIPLSKIIFMRQVLAAHPQLKSVPYKGKRRFKAV